MSQSVARWALSGWSGGLAATAALVVLLLPAQYYVPELAPPPPPPEPRASWLDRALDFPPVDLFVTLTLLLLGFFTYLCEWIQRKIMEKRIVKLNQYLRACVERLRAWDGQQEAVEGTLRQVQAASSEYSLLLFLLLRAHGCAPAVACPASSCFFDKGLPDPPPPPHPPHAPLCSVDA